MRTVFSILFLLILVMISKGQDQIAFTSASAESGLNATVTCNNTSSRVIRIINASGLKRIPTVLRDLATALNESTLQEQYLSECNDITIYLDDESFNSFEISAAVQYPHHDTMYHMKLNRFNERATDIALAATLIHEIMHCVLMDIYRRAVQQDLKAIDNIQGFGLRSIDSTHIFGNDFFYLMNSGNDGQHELIFRLFYPQMVSLLERFVVIHKQKFLNRKTAGRMMWTGLQNTNAFKKLKDEDKRIILTTIMEEKRIINEIQ